ncbi:AraC family transcriptional regulator [Bacteroides fragilis]|nr:AraC family transcriptional regulator [Bacteroides fragilis]
MRVNFPDQTTLSRYFRHYTGVTPSQYRKNIYF